MGNCLLTASFMATRDFSDGFDSFSPIPPGLLEGGSKWGGGGLESVRDL